MIQFYKCAHCSKFYEHYITSCEYCMSPLRLIKLDGKKETHYKPDGNASWMVEIAF